MWGRSYCSSLQGKSEIETQHLRNAGRKDALLKLNTEKLEWQCLLPSDSGYDPEGRLTVVMGKLAFAQIHIICINRERDGE